MFRNVLQLLLSNVAAMFAVAATSIISTRMLGPVERGYLAAALFVTMLSASCSQFGLTQSYLVSFRGNRAFDPRTAFVGSAWVATLSAALFCLFFAALTAHLTAFWLAPALLLAMATGCQYFFSALIQISPQFGTFAAFRALPPVITLLAYGLLIGTGLTAANAVSFVHAQTLAGFVAAGIMGTVAFRLIRTRSRSGYGAGGPWTMDFSMRALRFHGSALLALVPNNLDKLLLAAKATPEVFGFYALAFSTSRLLGTVLESISTTVFVRYASLGQTDQQLSVLAESTAKVFRVTLLPALCAAAIAAALSHPLFVLLFGKAFAPAATPFAVLCFDCAIGNVSWILAQRFNAAGQPGWVLLRQIAAIVPLLMSMPYLRSDNALWLLPGVILIGTLIALVVTIVLFRRLSASAIRPRLMPEIGEIRTLGQHFVRRLVRRDEASPRGPDKPDH